MSDELYGKARYIQEAAESVDTTPFDKFMEQLIAKHLDALDMATDFALLYGMVGVTIYSWFEGFSFFNEIRIDESLPRGEIQRAKFGQKPPAKDVDYD